MKLQAVLLATLSALAVQISWANPVTVSKAWVRPTLPGQTVAGAYLDITSKHPARLLAARSPLSPDVQIHWMKMEGDVMRMREVASIDLPQGKTVSLKPGGYHLMLMQLNKPIREGDTVPLTLVIETRGKRQTVNTVARAKSTADSSGTMHDHSKMHH